MEVNKILPIIIDRALDIYLEGSITKLEYDKKAMSLKPEQHELSNKLRQYTTADDEHNITANLLLDLASRVGELSESSKPEQKRRLLKTIFSNLKLEGEKLLFTVNKPSDLMLPMPGVQAGIPKGIRTPVAAVKGRCPRPTRRWGRLRDGEPGGGRTHDHLIKSQVLYQLSYRPLIVNNQ